jgi:hypothetical protein
MNKLLNDLKEANLSPEIIDFFTHKGEHIQVKNKSTLINSGTVCDKVYFVLKGGFVCRYIDTELEIEKTINFYLEDFHPVMACVDSIFTTSKTQCELRAITNSEVLAFDYVDIDLLAYQDSQFLKYYLSGITRALQEENDFKLKIIAYPSEKLYTYLITHCPLVIQQVPSMYIAEFMGISPEWLSKLKQRI